MERFKSITIIFLLLAVGLLASAAQAKPASVLLQEGLYAEEIEGDLDAAIKIYGQIIATPGAARRIAAHAAYRIGMCYLKKGEESRAIEQFQAIVSDFPEQTQIVARAQEQLSKLDVRDTSGEMDVPGGYPVKGGGRSIVEVVPAGLQSSLVLYYSFYADQGQTVMDISGRGRHGRVQGTTYASDAVLGGTMVFDGDDDYIDLSSIRLGAFSLSAWVMTATRDLNNRRIFLLDAGGDNYCAVQGNASGGVGVYITGDIEINEYDWQFRTGKWTHITVTYDGNRIGIYINGKLGETGVGSYSETVMGKAYLGFSGYFEGDSRHDGDECWHGKIDEVAVFDRGLTAEEVKALFDMTGRVDETGETAEIVRKAVLTISTCTESDPRVAESLDSLKPLADGPAINELCKYLESDTANVRRSAIFILWRGGFKNIAPAEEKLIKLCGHEENLTRGMSALALGSAKVAAGYEILADKTLNDSDGYVRRCAAYALGLYGDKKAMPVLEKALQDKDQLVKNNAQAAITMLTEPKDTEPK